METQILPIGWSRSEIDRLRAVALKPESERSEEERELLDRPMIYPDDMPGDDWNPDSRQIEFDLGPAESIDP